MEITLNINLTSQSINALRSLFTLVDTAHVLASPPTVKGLLTSGSIDKLSSSIRVASKPRKARKILTTAQRTMIAKQLMRDTPPPRSALAERYGVSVGTISNINKTLQKTIRKR